MFPEDVYGHPTRKRTSSFSLGFLRRPLMPSMRAGYGAVPSVPLDLGRVPHDSYGFSALDLAHPRPHPPAHVGSVLLGRQREENLAIRRQAAADRLKYEAALKRERDASSAQAARNKMLEARVASSSLAHAHLEAQLVATQRSELQRSQAERDANARVLARHQQLAAQQQDALAAQLSGLGGAFRHLGLISPPLSTLSSPPSLLISPSLTYLNPAAASLPPSPFLQSLPRLTAAVAGVGARPPRMFAVTRNDGTPAASPRLRCSRLPPSVGIPYGTSSPASIGLASPPHSLSFTPIIGPLTPASGTCAPVYVDPQQMNPIEAQLNHVQQQLSHTQSLLYQLAPPSKIPHHAGPLFPSRPT